MGRGTRLRLIAVVAVTVVAALAPAVLSATAQGSSPPTPWDGSDPFNCTVQDAGLGPTGPDPGADPYCVYFDKTDQNITQLGIASFLLLEPARTAAAVNKCFYFQEDHWRGSVVQSDQQTVLYEFYGHYFFNKATGDGGAYVTGFEIAGQTFDPTALPGFPPGYGQYFGPGTGGVITHDDIPVDPHCAAIANGDPGAVYASAANVPRCLSGAGVVNRDGIGPLRLGSTEDLVRGALGPPAQVKRGFLSYCVAGGGELLVGEPGDRSGTLGSGDAAAAMLLTTSRAFALRGHGWTARVGSRARALRRVLRRPRRLARLGSATVLRAGDLLAAVSQGRITYLGVYSRGVVRTRPGVLGYLRRAA